LIAALVATILAMTQDGWSVGISEGLAIFIIVLMIFIAKYFIQLQQESRLAKFAQKADITLVPVYRNSREIKNIKSNELVVGDLIQVRQGF
jgi:magnesium-transporting ATPase (P-type)